LKRKTETTYNFLQKHNIGYKKQTPLSLCIPVGSMPDQRH